MFFCRKVAPLFVLFPSPLAVYFVLDFTTAGCWLQSTPAFFSRTCELENFYRPVTFIKYFSVIVETSNKFETCLTFQFGPEFGQKSPNCTLNNTPLIHSFVILFIFCFKCFDGHVYQYLVLQPYNFVQTFLQFAAAAILAFFYDKKPFFYSGKS